MTTDQNDTRIVQVGHTPRSQPAIQAQDSVKLVTLMGVPIVALLIDGQERLCLAQISTSLLKMFSYNEIHNRRVALGINCIQCTPAQLEVLRRAGAMPISSRRCGMITMREAERLCTSFLGDYTPPKLPDNYSFDVVHHCAWGCRGTFLPQRYNSSRAKCIKCFFCGIYLSPNKFIFHSHRTPASVYVQPDAANFNSWRRHLVLANDDSVEEKLRAWEDVKSMFNGGSRKRGGPHSFTPMPDDESKRVQQASSQVVRSTNSTNQQLLVPPWSPVWPSPLQLLGAPLAMAAESQLSGLSVGMSSESSAYMISNLLQSTQSPTKRHRASDEAHRNRESVAGSSLQFMANDTAGIFESGASGSGTSGQQPRVVARAFETELKGLLASEVEARRRLENDLLRLKQAFLQASVLTSLYR